jgi:FtsH-binding integral membrane protein
MFESDVYKRTQAQGAVISDAAYNLCIGLVLFWGLSVNWLMVRHIETAWIQDINLWVFLIGYFASCFYGVHLFNTSSDPFVSFIGYNFVVVPFGLIVNLVVSRYEPALVLEAIQTTAGVTLVMMILGGMFPKFFQEIIGTLTIALLAVIIIELIQILVFKKVPEWIDWAVAGLFCGYIGYDWGRAQRIPKTLDNAVDSAAAIYMDIINLFLRILRILGRRR